ncbi:MAG: DUF2608 domain-containing protein [Rickettsiaceae bacterium]|nr:DUF2608 domain-containing protein [Rickettsiaceae bacterium]
MFKKLLFITLIIFLPMGTFAQIIELHKAQDLLKYTENLGPNDLVSFDVKNVLFVPEDLIYNPAYKEEMKKYWQQLEQELGKEETDLLNSIMLLSYKSVLVDNNMPSVIKALQAKKIKVIALTSGHTGQFCHIESLEALRIKRLKELDIDFSTSFPNLGTIELLGKNGEISFIFSEGVLFASRSPKGEVIEIFLDKINFHPRKIIHVDNSMHKLETMQKFCESHNIDFLGIHFTHIYKNIPPLNKKITDKKFDLLKTQKIWLSDEEVIKLIGK